jgi:hypothetical protein
VRFWSKEMNEPRFFLALVPKTPVAPSEVLILNHGWWDRPEGLLQYLKVDQVYDEMLGRGEVRPAIVVLPDVRFSNFYRQYSDRYPYPNYLTLVAEEVAGTVSRRYAIRGQMRALLVQSPATSPWVPRRQWEPPSVAMATIAGQIDNHDVRVADMVVWRKQAVPRFLELLRDFKPDVVGFTSMTFQYDTTAGFAYLTKQFDSRIRTVLGGYHATLFSDSIAAGQDAGLWDFLMRGEGDFAFGEMLDSIEAGGAGMDKILGLSYKEDGLFRHNPAAAA